MMEIVLGETFLLPRVGPEVFKKLMKEVHIDYDKTKRIFRITPQTDLYLLASILQDTLKKDVVYVVKCFVCGEKAGCTSCEYQDKCDRTKVSFSCICHECLSKEDAYSLYCMRFAELS